MAACTRRHAAKADQDREYRPFAQSPLLQFGRCNNYLSFVTGTTSFRGRRSTHPSAAGNASCSREATPSTRTSLTYHSAVIREIKSGKKTFHHNKLQHLPSTFFICLHLPRLPTSSPTCSDCQPGASKVGKNARQESHRPT